MSASAVKIRAILLSSDDNVVTLTAEAAAGDEVAFVKAGRDEVVVAKGKVPTGHKMAIEPIRKGEQAVKYAAPIGGATADIAPGEHVHIHNLASLRGKGAHRNG